MYECADALHHSHYPVEKTLGQSGQIADIPGLLHENFIQCA
jgi:hypothetical protein